MYHNKTNDIEKLLRRYQHQRPTMRDSDKLGDFVIYSNGKPLTVNDMYQMIAFSKNSVVCGRCSHRGTIRKIGKYYVVDHKYAEKETCYIGKEPTVDIAFVPVRIIS